MPDKIREDQLIADWMNDENCRIINCYNQAVKDHKETEFFNELININARIEQLEPEYWSDIAISRCIKGLMGMSVELKEVRAILKNLTYILQQLCLTDYFYFDVTSIALALNSLKYNNDNSVEIRELLRVLTYCIEHKVWKEFSGKDISLSLAGLINMRSNSPDLKGLLGALTKKINQSGDELNGEEIGYSLTGLLSLPGDSPDAIALINAITRKIPFSGVYLNAYDIGRALYSLKNFSSQSVEIRSLLGILALYIKKSEDLFYKETIGFALYGLQNMRADSKEMAFLLGVLAKKIIDSDDVLDEKAIGMALYGLQNMSSDAKEVQDLLRALNLKIKSSSKALNKQTIGNALYGLRSMNSKSVEVQELLNLLTEKTLILDEDLGPQEIGNSLYGLQHMDLNIEAVVNLLIALEKKSPKEAITYKKEPMAWTQIVAAGYELLYNSKKERIDLPGLKLKSLSIREIELLFMKKLITHYQKDKIDLHNLNYISAKLLLKLLFREELDLKGLKIVFGRSSHSKLKDFNKMRDLVENFLKSVNMTGDIDYAGGAIYNIQPIKNTNVHEQKSKAESDGWTTYTIKKKKYPKVSFFQISDTDLSVDKKHSVTKRMI